MQNTPSTAFRRGVWWARIATVRGVGQAEVGDAGLFAGSPGADCGGGGGRRGAPGGRATLRGGGSDDRELPAVAARDGGLGPASAPRCPVGDRPGAVSGAPGAVAGRPGCDPGAALRDLGRGAGAGRQRQHEGAHDRAAGLDAQKKRSARSSGTRRRGRRGAKKSRAGRRTTWWCWTRGGRTWA